MAQPIPLELPSRDPRAELQARLQTAPLQHAEALLSAYDVLQGLHDRGVFDLIRASLGSGDKVTEIVVNATKSPEVVTGLRNLIVLAKILGTIRPEILESFARSLPEAIAHTETHDSHRPWRILSKIPGKDFRRGLALANSILEAVGRNLPSDQGKPGK